MSSEVNAGCPETATRRTDPAGSRRFLVPSTYAKSGTQRFLLFKICSRVRTSELGEERY